jgi:hypothetical protein
MAGRSLPRELAAQPGARQAKVMAHDVDRSADDHRGLLGSHAAEVVHFHHVGKRLVLARERFQGVLQFQHVQLPTAAPGDHFDVHVPLNTTFGSPALRGADRACMVDQHLPHHPRHQREKVCAVHEHRLHILEQLDERFVDERRGLQRMPRPLAPHERPGHPAQLAVDLRHQLVERTWVSRAQLLEQHNDL